MVKIFRTAAAIAVTTALGSTAALAQSMTHPSFTGWGVGLNASYQNNSVNISPVAGNLSKDETEAALTGSYGFAMGNDWVGTVGLAIGLQDSSRLNVPRRAFTVAATPKQQFAVSFAPGLRIGSNGLVYGKLAVHQMDVSYKNIFNQDRTLTHMGTGVGIGYAHALTPSLELSLEYEAVDFDSKSSQFDSVKPKQDMTSLGLTYRF